MISKKRNIFMILVLFLISIFFFSNLQFVYASELPINGEAIDGEEETNTSNIPIIDDTQMNTLIIEYYDDLDASLPIVGAEFTIYKVADMDEYGGFISLIDNIDFSQAPGHEEDFCTDEKIEAIKKQIQPIGITTTNANGKATISLEKGMYIVQETKSAQYHVKSNPFLVQLPVVATAYDGDYSEYIVNDLNEMYWKYEFTVMPKSLATGNLKISKTVKGNSGELDKVFHFQVTFDTDIEFTYKDSKGNSGKITSGDTIGLKSGEYITIEDLPSGCKYSVVEKEANQDGYTTTYELNDGTIVRFKTIDCNVINTKNPPPKTNDMINIYIIIGVAIISFVVLLLTRKRNKQ